MLQEVPSGPTLSHWTCPLLPVLVLLSASVGGADGGGCRARRDGDFCGRKVSSTTCKIVMMPTDGDGAGQCRHQSATRRPSHAGGQEGQASVGQRRSFVEMDLFRVGRWGQVHAVAGCIESAKRFRPCGSASRGSLCSMCNGQVGRRWRFVGIAVSADPA